jgi:WD40 repeat protein
VEALGFAGDTLRVVRSSGWLQEAQAATGLYGAARPVDFTSSWIVPATLAAFSPDARNLAAVKKESLRIVNVIEARTGDTVRELVHPFEVLHVAFSRDGQRLATSAYAWNRDEGRREITVWDPGTGQRLTTVACAPVRLANPSGVVALSSDGRLLAYDEYLALRRKGEENRPDLAARVCLRDLGTGQPRKTLTDLHSMIRALAFSPDGRYLAVAAEVEGLLIYDCQADRWLHRLAEEASTADPIWDLAFSPDSSRLATVTRGHVKVWDVVTGQMVLLLRGAPPRTGDNGFNPRVAWSPDGRFLAASSWNLSVSIWDTAERQTPAAKQALYRAAETRARLE